MLMGDDSNAEQPGGKEPASGHLTPHQRAPPTPFLPLSSFHPSESGVTLQMREGKRLRLGRGDGEEASHTSLPSEFPI